MTPICLPSSPTSRTSGTRIRSLIRVWSRSGGRRSNFRGTGTSCGGCLCVKRRRAVCGEALGSTQPSIAAGSARRGRFIGGSQRAFTSPSRRSTNSSTANRSLVALAVLAHAQPARPPARGRRRPACTGSCAARRRGSCARPTRCGRRARPAGRPPAAGSTTSPAYGMWRSAIGSTIACTGASHSRQLALEVLEQDPDEPLVGAHQRPVDHHRAVLGVVGAGVGEVEALREVVVELNGAELPRAAERVGHVHVDLRAVEGAVALVEVVLQALGLERAASAPPRSDPTARRSRSAPRDGSRAPAGRRCRTPRRWRTRTPGSRRPRPGSGPRCRRCGRRPGRSGGPAAARAACRWARGDAAAPARSSAPAGRGRSGAAASTAGSGPGSSSA